tara:strand:+ start:150 stop:455 length:306 start_codon:yes stop_codon:yes gene_type:complete
MSHIIEDLIQIIKNRKGTDVSQSYTSSLLTKGLKECIKKMDEEFDELKEAIKNKKNIEHESADLLYHFLVTLESAGINFNDVLNELEKRKGKSGFDEKNSR